MKNVFVQKNFGECFATCAANWFNDDWFLRTQFDFSKGVSLRQGRKFVESFTDNKFTLTPILLSNKPIGKYLPLFEDVIPDECNENADYYKPFFVTIKSRRKGYAHCVLVIKELHNDTLTVLDPNKRDGYQIPIKKAFQKLKPIQIEMISSSEYDDMLFASESVEHLIN